MKPDIVIMTSAIDRPDLHAHVFELYKQYIGTVNVHWVITVNNVFNRLNETKNQLQTILNNYPLYIHTYESGGTRKDWYESVKYCINYAYKLQPHIAYLFLEDDWLFNETSLLQEDLLLITQPNSYLSLAGRLEVSFNPGLWGTAAFDKLMYYSINNKETSLGSRYVSGDTTSPERVCCPYPEATKFVTEFKHVNRFKDVGRDWQNKNIGKRTFNVKE